MQDNFRVSLYNLLSSEKFSLEDLQNLAFQLNIDWENLGGETKTAKARNLVEYCSRHARRKEIISKIREARPDVDLSGLATSVSPDKQPFGKSGQDNDLHPQRGILPDPGKLPDGRRKMGNIFISYSHKDEAYVHRLQEALQKEGFEVWIDGRIDYGTRWPQVIQDQLDSCSVFIVVVSENSLESEWVQNEVARAKRKKKPFFPLLLSGDLWLSVESTQCVDVTDHSLPPKKFYDDLARVVQRISVLSSPPPQKGFIVSLRVRISERFHKNKRSVFRIIGVLGTLLLIWIGFVLFSSNPGLVAGLLVTRTLTPTPTYTVAPTQYTIDTIPAPVQNPSDTPSPIPGPTITTKPNTLTTETALATLPISEKSTNTPVPTATEEKTTNTPTPIATNIINQRKTFFIYYYDVTAGDTFEAISVFYTGFSFSVKAVKIAAGIDMLRVGDRVPVPVYIVEKGDTLFSISSSFGLSQKDLQEGNGISGSDFLFAGSKIIIPINCTVTDCSNYVSP